MPAKNVSASNISSLNTGNNLPHGLVDSFLLTGETAKSYSHQFANIYFARLTLLKPTVLNAAENKWKDVAGNPVPIPRVLDVVKSQLCYVIGTVYMDMPLKPNVLVDIGKEHWIVAPPSRPKFNSPEDSVMLEDESGRIKLVGEPLKQLRLVTGVIIAALGVETSAGEFQVVDVCFAGMAPQGAPLPLSEHSDMEVDQASKQADGSWVAFISGLDISSSDVQPGTDDAADIRLQLFVEYLKGESGGPEEQGFSSQCSALIVLGNSLDIPKKSQDDLKNSKRYNSQTTWDPVPLHRLTRSLKELARSVPVHILPGATDPAPSTLPQQPMPKAMFGFEASRELKVFMSETNPAWLDIGAWGLLATSGQTLDDIFKYIESSDRLAMACDTLLWRHIAPTCPDTLWCYPFFDRDPFVLAHSPSVYAVGNQPAFESELMIGPAGERTRVVLVPKFSETGQVVLVNTASLAVRMMRFNVAPGWE